MVHRRLSTVSAALQLSTAFDNERSQILRGLRWEYFVITHRNFNAKSLIQRLMAVVAVLHLLTEVTVKSFKEFNVFWNTIVEKKSLVILTSPTIKDLNRAITSLNVLSNTGFAITNIQKKPKKKTLQAFKASSRRQFRKRSPWKFMSKKNSCDNQTMCLTAV